MFKHRSRILGAALAFLIAACSESPTSPAAAPAQKAVDLPTSGPVHTDNFVSIGNPPPGGVTSSESGDPGDMGGRSFSYSGLQNGMFDMLAWGKGAPYALSVVYGGFPSPLTFQGVGAGEAIWTTAIPLPNSQTLNIRVTLSSPTILPTADLSPLGLPSTDDAVFVLTGSSFTATLRAFGQVGGTDDDETPVGGMPLNLAVAQIPNFSGPPPTVFFMPAFLFTLKSCDAGYYLTGTGCIEAPAGSYSSGGSVTSATQCPTGTYQPDAGQYFCTNAPRGSYAAGPGATEATLCSPGYYADTFGLSSCIAAPRGTYVNTEGATAPVQCAAGSYNNSLAQTSCSLAPAGYYAPAGAHTPTPCAAGSFSSTSGSASCTPAPAGSFVSSTGQTHATLCAIGMFSATAGQASCTTAPTGYYVDVTGATSATPAPAGSFATGPGATSSTMCSAGYYQPSAGQGSCIAAAIGFFVATTGATSQTACQLGWTTNAVGSTSCVKMDPIVAYDALITAAQNTPGVGNGDVNKLVTARKQLVAGKSAQACSAIDSFVAFVTKQSGKKITTANANMLLLKSQIADIAIGC